MQDHGYYGPGSATWKIASETVITLGGTRAVLMQIAHPLVAMGVSEHSSYMTDPFGRTEHTFVLGQLLTFGSIATARDAARTINRLHTHVHGQLYDSAGAYSSGTLYRARAVAVDRIELGFVDILPCEGCLDHPLLGPKEELFRRREIVGATEPPRATAPVLREGVRID